LIDRNRTGEAGATGPGPISAWPSPGWCPDDPRDDTDPLGLLHAALLMLGDEHPSAPQRQLGSKCFRQPIVDLKQRIEDFILSPKPDTEIQLVPTLLNGLLEPSPTDKQTLIGMRILNGTYQSLQGWLIGNDVAPT
jgi:hypothetical protein